MPRCFVVSQWQSNTNGCLKYLIYAWTLATYFTFVLILSIYTASECKQVDFYLIYLTNWNVMLNALSSLFGAIVITRHYNNSNTLDMDNERETNRMGKLLETHWFLSTLSPVVSISVSLAYWPSYDGRDAGLNDVLTHAGNSVILFADTFIHARPPRYGHLIYPLAFGIVYLILFSLPYQLLGGLNRHYKAYIYPSLDWTNNTTVAIKSTLLLSASFVLVHLFVTFSITVRCYLYTKYKSPKEVMEVNGKSCHEQSIV
ncbi:protein rolling stone-like [Bradysia coprophila]|uniref:protein rolling stone-like n=1 Tax=Bradysia coprophila TaxID=38358 RepID=UPI00187DB720|nr:protein rolling stone-like [Bradysia coprophila]